MWRVTHVNAQNRVFGGFRGIDGREPPPDLRARAETQLRELLRVEGLPDRGVYRPGEVCRLLRISPTTLRQFCDLAAHPAVKNSDPRVLESFLVGCHRRIHQAAIVEWLARNQTFQRHGQDQDG